MSYAKFIKRTIFLLLFLFIFGQVCRGELELNDYRDDEIEAPCTPDRLNGGQVCNCGYQVQNMVLPIMDGTIYQIRLLNCKTLRIRAETFSHLQSITRINLENIENLLLEANSLSFPSQLSTRRIQLTFSNINIEEIPSHAINGNIDEILFENCRIGVVRAFALTALAMKVHRLAVQNTIINRLDPQAFKKFTVEQLVIFNSKFMAQIPSRAFYDLEVSDSLSIAHSNFSSIFSSALIFEDVGSLTVEHNQFDEIHGDSFQISVRNSISIEHNTIVSLNGAAFKSITVDVDYSRRNSEPMEFIFNSNTFDLKDSTFAINFNPQFRMKISNIYIRSPIQCSHIDDLVNYEFLHDHAHTIYFKIDDLANANDSVQTNTYYSFSELANHICIKETYLLYIIIGVSVLSVLLIIVTIIAIVFILRRRKERQLNIIMPEVKTYRETQIVMQIENAGLLKTDL